MCFTATSDKYTATANVRRWRLVSASFLSTNWRASVSPSPQVCCSRLHTRPTMSLLAPTSAAEVLKLLTLRPLESSPVDVLPSVLLRRVLPPLCRSCHTWPTCRSPSAVSQRRSRQHKCYLCSRSQNYRQGADVQLPADIQPDNHLEGDRTAGARQATATPALISPSFSFRNSTVTVGIYHCRTEYHQRTCDIGLSVREAVVVHSVYEIN